MGCRRSSVRDKNLAVTWLLCEEHTSTKLFVNTYKFCKPFWTSGKKRSIKTFYLENSWAENIAVHFRF